MIVCRQKKSDCTFNELGRCKILNNTQFNRPCPFYKKGYEAVREYVFKDHPGAFRQIDRNPKYYVSEYGEVVNKNGRPVRPKRDSVGYLSVVLYGDAGKQQVRIAVLLADAFLQEQEGHIEYKDGDRDNITIYNVCRVKGKT